MPIRREKISKYKLRDVSKLLNLSSKDWGILTQAAQRQPVRCDRFWDLGMLRDRSGFALSGEIEVHDGIFELQAAYL